jgi:hypothetical protein
MVVCGSLAAVGETAWGSWSFLDSITKLELGNEEGWSFGGSWSFLDSITKLELGNEEGWSFGGSWSFLDSITKLELGNEEGWSLVTRNQLAVFTRFSVSKIESGVQY